MNMLLYMNSDGSAFGNGNPVSNAKDAFDAINNRAAFLF